MQSIEQILRNLEAYPRWFVAICTAIAGLAVLWVLAKLLKWTLYVVVGIIVAAILLGAAVWWLG